jgi:eukaryotic-like serine/threonine-protein kinase
MVERAAWEQLNGTQIGPYHLKRLLDQHQWGPIFQADDASSQSYAVRFIGMPGSVEQKELSAEKRLIYIGRFQQAANNLASLQHPRIIPVLDYGVHQEMPYLIYPYRRLTSLRAFLKTASVLDPLTIGRWLEQIVEGISYGHSQGVLHRNLSSLSVLVRPDRRLLLDEFGLLYIREIYRQYFPLPGEFDGTSEATAPEQWLHKPIDAYADIYALGAVLYRMLTGHAPFEGNTREEVMQMHLSTKPRKLTIWRGDLPDGLDALLSKALAKEPSQRFQKPQELLEGYWDLVAPEEAARLRASSMKNATLETTNSQKMKSIPADVPMIARGAQRLRTPPAPAIHTSAGSIQSMSDSRRRLLTLLALGGLGVLGVGGAVEWGLSAKKSGSLVTSSGKPSQAGGGNTIQGTLLAKSADLPLNSAKTFPLNGQKNPGILIHLQDNRFVAFDSTCTHESCAVSYSPEDHQLICPCHDAIFDPAKNAAVIQGPAKIPLTAVNIKVNADGTITM